MHIKDHYKKKKFVFSFEVMPQRNGEDIEKVYSGVNQLLKYRPSFISVTQGSESSLRGGTPAIASEIKRRFNVDTLAHFICIGKSDKDVENELMLYHYLGIENIMAIRGDAPWGESEYKPKENGFLHASDLVSEIQRKNKGHYNVRKSDIKFYKLDPDAKYRQGIKTNFCVGVAGYPEGHKECKDKIKNIQYLKEKADAGSDVIFTQMFYKPEYYFDFVKNCRQAGIKIPIVPGIMPITFRGQIEFLRNTCAVEIPPDFLIELENCKDSTRIADCSVDYITKMCKELIKRGIPGLHLYTLNNFTVAERILNNLKMNI